MSAFALRAPAHAASGVRNGRPSRASTVRVQAVAVPRAAPTASPSPNATGRHVSTEATAIAAMPVTSNTAVLERIVHVVTAESFHDFLGTHADKLCVIDFFAVWCGPCKMIAPELEKMANEVDPSKIVFAKLDCGATNESKKLAMSLGIKALPTFHLYRENKLADQMTGAKVKSLQDLIQKHA